jgi:hypothetical protein
MANHLAIHSFAQSLLTFLQQSHATFSPALPAATFEVLSSGRFSSADKELHDPSVTIYLHRISANNHLRNTRTGPPVGPLGLDLHFLLTVWTNVVETELVLMGWAMRELHYHSFLDVSSLSADAEWAVDEVVSIFSQDMSPEEMARIWEASNRGYRLSYPFVARIVRLGQTGTPAGEPVVASRFTFTDNLAETEP